MTIRFTFDKMTKNTVRFGEVLDSDLDAAKIGSLYVSKAALKEIGWNERKDLFLSLEAKVIRGSE